MVDHAFEKCTVINEQLRFREQKKPAQEARGVAEWEGICHKTLDSISSTTEGGDGREEEGIEEKWNLAMFTRFQHIKCELRRYRKAQWQASSQPSGLNPFRVTYQISSIADIDIVTQNSIKITLMNNNKILLWLEGTP